MNEGRVFATLESEIVDEPIFSDSEDIDVPGGQIIARAIAEIIEKMGFSVTDAAQYKFYGWDFEARIDGQKYWFLLQDAEPWLLIAEDKTGFFATLKRKTTSLRDTLVDLNRNLSNDKRFSNIRWFTRVEYESGNASGAGSP